MRRITLLALIVALCLLSLVSCSVTVFFPWGVLPSKARAARASASESQIAVSSIALERFKLDVGRFPTTQEGLHSLVTRPSAVAAEAWDGPYTPRTARELSQDPWGQRYIYQCPGKHLPDGFDLYSLGADGKSMTEGNDPDDINNWSADAPWRVSYGTPSLLLERTGQTGWGVVTIICAGAVVLLCRMLWRSRR